MVGNTPLVHLGGGSKQGSALHHVLEAEAAALVFEQRGSMDTACDAPNRPVHAQLHMLSLQC